MRLILLPGNVKTNNAWVEKAKSIFSDKFDVVSLDYANWPTLSCNMTDLDFELEKLLNVIDGCEDYIIAAKTTGIAVTFKGVAEKKLNPQKCIFIGVPIVWARINDLPVDNWIKDFWIPTLVIQSENDPSMCVDELDAYLKNANKKRYKIVKIKGQGMHYDNILELKQPILEFLEEFKEETPHPPKYL